jgi:hypothetical protein
MAGIEDTIWCDGCGTEITWGPVTEGKRRYCCQDCLNGIPCRCGERLDSDEERRDSSSSTANLPGGLLP